MGAGQYWQLAFVPGHGNHARASAVHHGFFVAAEVESNVRSRFGALEMIAQAMPAGIVDNHRALQDFLDQRFVLHQQFNGGVLVRAMTEW